jgi:hypothetical protein
MRTFPYQKEKDKSKGVCTELQVYIKYAITAGITKMSDPTIRGRDVRIQWIGIGAIALMLLYSGWRLNKGVLICGSSAARIGGNQSQTTHYCLLASRNIDLDRLPIFTPIWCIY